MQRDCGDDGHDDRPPIEANDGHGDHHVPDLGRTVRWSFGYGPTTMPTGSVGLELALVLMRCKTVGFVALPATTDFAKT